MRKTLQMPQEDYICARAAGSNVKVSSVCEVSAEHLLVLTG